LPKKPKKSELLDKARDMGLPVSRIQPLELSPGALKTYIDSKIDFIEGKVFKKPTDIALSSSEGQNLELFDMNQLERSTPLNPAPKQNIMVERNLIEVPIAKYAKQIVTNWVKFKKNNIETSVGTPHGALNGFDERLLWGVIAYRFQEYHHNGQSYYISRFTSYEAMKELKLAKTGFFRQKINDSSKKLGSLIINYKNFRFIENGEKKYVELDEQYPMFKYQGTAHVKDELREKSYHIFIWNDMFAYNFVNQYVKYLSKQRFVEIKDDLTRRLWMYLSCKLGAQKIYNENITSLLERVGINEVRTNKPMATKILKNKLSYLTEHKDFENYRIKNDVLTIFPTRKHPELRDRILNWLYRDTFNKWVQTPREIMRTKLDTLIKNYGSNKIQEVFLATAEYHAAPHPTHFLRAVKELENTVDPVTTQITHSEIQKLKKKAGL